MFSPFILRLLHSTSRERSYLESRYYDDINTKDVYQCEGILLLFLLELEARIENLVPWLDNVSYSLLRIQRSNLKTGYYDKACVHYFHNTVRLVPSFWKCFVIYFINPRCCSQDHRIGVRVYSYRRLYNTSLHNFNLFSLYNHLDQAPTIILSMFLSKVMKKYFKGPE